MKWWPTTKRKNVLENLKQLLGEEKQKLNMSRDAFKEQLAKSQDYINSIRKTYTEAESMHKELEDSIRSSVGMSDPQVYGDDTLSGIMRAQEMDTVEDAMRKKYLEEKAKRIATGLEIPIGTVVEAPKRNMTLWELQDMATIAEEVTDADGETLAMILGDVAKKVDATKSIIDMFTAEAARYKGYKDEMAQRQKTLENAVDRIKAYTVACLKGHGTTFELGTMWQAQIKQSERLICEADPSEQDYLNLGLHYPKAIRRKYEWDKNEIKALLKEGNQDLLAHAQIVTSDSLQFKTINIAKRK